MLRRQAFQIVAAGLIAAAVVACFDAANDTAAGAGGGAGIGAASAQGACAQWEVLHVEPNDCTASPCQMPAGWEPFTVGSSVDVYVRRCVQ